MERQPRTTFFSEYSLYRASRSLCRLEGSLMFGTKLTFSDKTSDAESIIHPWGVQFTKRIRAFCSKQKKNPKKRE
jgi:hypothetical protein